MAAMVIDMNETRLCALEQLRAFLEGMDGGNPVPVRRGRRGYSHIQTVLKRFAYPRLKRADKRLVLRNPGRTGGTRGYSRQ